MTLDEFIAKYYPFGFYPNGEPLPGRREEFNRRNSQLLCRNMKTDIVFIGDSIIDWWEVGSYFSKYGNVVNRGIGGECTPELVERFQCDALDLNPRVIVTLEGINDLGELLQYSKEHKIVPEELKLRKVAAIIENYKKIFEMAKLTSVQLLVCSILPIGSLDVRNRVMIEINARLERLAKEYGFEFVNLYAMLVEDDGVTLKKVHFGDDLHPHVLGYNIMAEMLYPYLDSVFGV